MRREAEGDGGVLDYFSLQNVVVALRFALTRAPIYEGADDPWFGSYWAGGRVPEALLTHEDKLTKGEWMLHCRSLYGASNGEREV